MTVGGGEGGDGCGGCGCVVGEGVAVWLSSWPIEKCSNWQQACTP